ncbi:MAG: tetraacyldisaccharide 4'-kinase [Prevotellaceae bacterium]|nr:tetraacyldisaccharide 4'-kinase [Prevotellaceae bacterium]
MESDLVEVKKWLLPLSWLYGIGVSFRNAMYDMGIFKSQSFPLPIISVGNITCGGTGKTPHVEYIVRLLCKKHRLAVLSRGYKRKGKGYKLASLNTPMHAIGDEPWQLRHKFRNIYVAVDENRTHGITRLCNDSNTKDVEIILLDDAYQHLSVRPGLNILLVDYHRLITNDELLPAGRLREPAENKSRANIVIVTKCPSGVTPMGFRVIQKHMDLRPYQKLFFSTLRYGSLKGLFIEEERELESIKPQESVFLLTGIATPKQMRQDLEHYTKKISMLSFPDHHAFTAGDIRKINSTFETLPHPRIAITTEKDATRLIYADGLSDELCDCLYVLPVEVEILRGEAKSFNLEITNYVLKNPRNISVAKKSNDH